MICNTPGLFVRSCLHGKSAGADEGDEDRRRSRSELKNIRTAPLENGTPTERQGARIARSPPWSDPRRHPPPRAVLSPAQIHNRQRSHNRPAHPRISGIPLPFHLFPPPSCLHALATSPLPRGYAIKLV
ncbi:hypothetical protein FIBSPDRAFT_870145, partial [Athelia psychrophila]